jgi:hypothetical protein
LKTFAKPFIAIAIAVGLIATPLAASAVGTRTLATNNKLYGFDGAGTGTYGNLSQLNELTGGSTAIGTRGTFSPTGYPLQAAFDVTSNSIYWINSDVQNSIPNYLMKANITTGVSTMVGEFKEGATAKPIDSMAIAPTGEVYGFSDTQFFSIDKNTAALTLISNDTGQNRIYSFAYNPADSNFYAISNDTDGGLYAVTVATGAINQIRTIADFPNLGSGNVTNAKRVYSMAFDQSGNLWGVNLSGDLFSTVVTGTDAADFVTGIQEVGTPGQTWTNSIAITYPAPVQNNTGGGLANTGTNSDLTNGLSAAALAALFAGVAMLYFARRSSN